MVAHMNAEALAKTLETGEAWYWSRSRGELWHKGATSGQIQTVVEMRVDCDQDALWLKVRVARRRRLLPHRTALVLLPRVDADPAGHAAALFRQGPCTGHDAARVALPSRS